MDTEARTDVLLVGGQWRLDTQKRQPMDSVSDDRCQQCGKEGSAYRRQYECLAQKILLEMPRDISIRQQQTVTSSNERLVWDRGLTVKATFEKSRLSMGGHTSLQKMSKLSPSTKAEGGRYTED